MPQSRRRLVAAGQEVAQPTSYERPVHGRRQHAGVPEIVVATLASISACVGGSRKPNGSLTS
jgi:hypothetical protein